MLLKLDKAQKSSDIRKVLENNSSALRNDEEKAVAWVTIRGNKIPIFEGGKLGDNRFGITHYKPRTAYGKSIKERKSVDKSTFKAKDNAYQKAWNVKQKIKKTADASEKQALESKLTELEKDVKDKSLARKEKLKTAKEKTNKLKPTKQQLKGKTADARQQTAIQEDEILREWRTEIQNDINRDVIENNVFNDRSARVRIHQSAKSFIGMRSDAVKICDSDGNIFQRVNNGIYFQAQNGEKIRTEKLLDRLYDNGYSIQNANGNILLEKKNVFEFKTIDGEMLNVTLNSEEQFTDGTASGYVVHNAVVLENKDGVRFVFKSNMDKKKQNIDIENAIRSYNNVSQEIKDRGQKRICFVDYKNPADAYWFSRYKDFKGSYMIGGDEITVWGQDYHDYDYMTGSFAHEIGHFNDYNNYIKGKTHTYANNDGVVSDSAEWRDATAKDKALSFMDAVTKYGKNSPSEDFAECFMMYTKDRGYLEAYFPNRYKIIKDLLSH